MNVTLNGYRVTGTDMIKVHKVLEASRPNVQEAITEEYHRLLSLEAAQLVDDIAMGHVQPPQMPLLQVAQTKLEAQLCYASRGYFTEYNLSAPIRIMCDQADTYLLLLSSNPVIVNAITGSSEDLEWFGTSTLEWDEDKCSSVLAKWEELQKGTMDDQSLSCLQAEVSGTVALDTSRLHFEPVPARAKERARHSYMNMMLSVYACGQEIPPHQLMPLIDRVFHRLLQNESQAAIEELTIKLAAILPEITVDLLTKVPQDQ